MPLANAPLFVGGLPGTPEMVVILMIAILLFGANKIPKLARSTGQAIGEFQRGRQELEQELEDIQEETGLNDTPGSTTTDADTESSTATETSTSEEKSSN